jgi:3-deoxy-D-manno-octulosonate 8-phosphate phosphatase (KDO 8-P phosphatase)
MPKESKQLTDGLQNLQAIAFDVDGTLTDGTLTWNASDPASESKSFHFTDIMGISLARRLGIQLALISGEPSPLVDRFAEKLRIPTVVKGCRDKATALQEWSAKTGVPLANTCFFGDDVNDLGAMEIAGICACPADSAEEVVRYVQAHPRGFVSQQLGGAGAVREFIDLLLKTRNLEGKHVFKVRPPE